MFCSMFSPRLASSKNEHDKMNNTLERLVNRGLLLRLPQEWHNGTFWILTEQGATWGQYFAEEFLETRAFLQRRDNAIQNDLFRAQGPPADGVPNAVREGKLSRKSRK